jgi:hypothetical protein
MAAQTPAGGRRKPSPALVIAILALVLALGGTSYAALSIPNNSIATAQLRNGAVTAAKTQAGAGVSLIYSAGPIIKVKANGTTFGVAKCPAGTYPVGGGIDGGSFHVAMVGSVPWNTVKGFRGTPNSWEVFVRNTEAGAPQTFGVIVVCTSAAQARSLYG